MIQSLHLGVIFLLFKLALTEVPKEVSLPLSLEYIGLFSCATDGNCDDQGSRYIPSTLRLTSELLIDGNPELEPFHNLSYLYTDISTIKPPYAAREASARDTTVSVLGLSSDCFLETTILNVKKKLAVADACRLDVSSYKGYPRTSVLLNAATDSAAKAINYYLDEYGWYKVAVVSPSSGVDSFSSKVRSDLMETLSAYGRTILVDSRPNPTLNYSAIKNQVQEDGKKARIFIIFDPTKGASLLRSYYYAMADVGLLQTGEYFVLAFVSYAPNVDWINSENPDRTLHFGQNSVSPFNVSFSDLQLIYRNLLVFSDGPPPFYVNEEWAEFGTKLLEATKIEQCQPYCNTTPKYDIPPRWDRIQKASDSVQLLAVAGSEAYEKGVDVNNGSQLYEYVLTRTIKSVTGFEEYIDGYGDAVGSAQVYYFSANSKLGGFGLWAIGRLGQPSMQATNWTLTAYNNTSVPIDFINGTAPSDTPECGFNGELCGPAKSPIFIIIMACLALIMFVIACVVIFMYRKWRLEAKLHSLEFLIEKKNIILKKHVNMFSQTSILSFISNPDSKTFKMSQTEGSHLIIQEVSGPTYEVQSEAERHAAKSALALQGSQFQLPRLPQQQLISEIEQKPPTLASNDEKWNNLPDFSVGMFNGRTIALKRLYFEDIELSRATRMEILQIQETKHSNLIGFVGMVCDSPNVFLVNEFAARGSLRDLLDNEDLPVDNDFLNQVTRDIVAGLDFLHSSQIGCHGRLKSTNCLLDSRWMIKLSSFGLRQLRQGENPIRDGVQEGRDDLWTAPELLRWSTGLGQCSNLIVQKADVYSLGMLAYELYGKNGPWGDEPMEPKNIVRRVRDLEEGKKPFRPDMNLLKDSPEIIQKAVEDCWQEDPTARPSVHQLKKRFRPLTAGMKHSIMDNMVHIIEKYTEKLEQEIRERNTELSREKEKCDQLLQQMLPPQVVESLKRGLSVAAQSFECVTIYFSDCPGFSKLSSESEPMDIVRFLNDLYTLFDNIINRFDVYKVETISDAYMVASGLPENNGNHHAGEIASMALALLESVQTFKIHHRPEEKVRLRVGMHTGPVVAGVVGLKMPRYCLFGDTVNTASRMESNGIPLRINCSKAAKEMLDSLGGYHIEERGLVEMKGKGQQMTYFVNSENKVERLARVSRDMVKYRTLRRVIGEEEKSILADYEQQKHINELNGRILN